MQFEVRWSPQAVESIERIFGDEEDAMLIANAIREFDHQLRTDPGTRGESRPGGKRIIFSPPLAALVEIQWRLDQVLIGTVWRFEQHH